jgi:site-specific recombinase XerD
MSKQLDYVKVSCLSYLSRFERSSNRIRRFLRYWENLEVFLGPAENSLSEELIWEYDSEFSVTMGRAERHDLRRDLTIICFIAHHDLPPEGFHISICQAFWDLPIWCRKAIRDFQESCKHLMSLTTLSNYEVSLSCFFIRLDLETVKNTSQLTHKAIIRYSAADETPELSKRNRNSDVKSFLKYLEKLGLVKPTIHLVLEPSFQNEAILLDPIQYNAYPWKVLSVKRRTEPIAVYEQGVAKLEEYLTKCSYSQNHKKALIHGATEFELFLYCNDMGYSIGIADEWMESRRHFWSKSEYYSNLRAVHLIHELLMGKPISPFFPHVDRGKYHINENLEHHLLDYIEYRKHECLKPSSISMIHSSCCRFLGFVESLGIRDISELTPQIVKDFNLQDHHATIGGKQAYNARIRNFLFFLATKNLVPMSLHLALPAMAARKDRIITVLGLEQQTAIEAQFNNPRTKMEKRDNALVALGYDLGIRGIDIVALQFSHIDWDKEIIRFRQQKTGVWTTIPFTVNVGNALYAYITEARPESDSPYVFLSFKAPHGNMGSSVCRDSIGRIMKNAELAPCTGFHITRKTFASKLLMAGTPFSTISDLLGHSDNTTLKVYLASNEPEIRQCAMTLQGIEYQGGLL